MQQINLYQKEFQAGYNRDKIGVISLIVLLTLILAGTNSYQVYTLNQLRTELANKKGTLKSLEHSYAVLEKEVKPKARDMKLAASVDRMKRSNAEKLRALNYLSGNDAGNVTGFSFLIQGLGRKRDKINDLWLKKIQFGRGGYDMYLSGSSYQPELLPKFIQALSDEEIYKGREFREISMLRSAENNKVMDFVLDTRYQAKVKDSEVNNASVTLFMARLKKMASVQEIVQ
ncbi:MAG: hypothetical protein KAS57_00940 [Gammaproteobacteria bacterium]|nr:hypothetical protein [Gammaproteobacteria bacterium]